MSLFNIFYKKHKLSDIDKENKILNVEEINKENVNYGLLENEWSNCEKLVDIYINCYLEKYDYQKYEIKKKSIVLLIEDSFVISFSLRLIDNTIGPRYVIVIEELMPNEIFKFVESSFRSKIWRWNSEVSVRCPISYYYKKFTGEYEKYSYSNFVETQKIDSMLNEINSNIPELKLKQRYEDWEGWQYYFIIYELCYGNNKGFAIHYTQNSFPLNYAYSNEKKLEELPLPSPETNSLFNNGVYYYNKYAISKEFVKIKNKMYDDYINKVLSLETNAYGYTSLFNKYLYYFVIPKKIKKESEIHKLTKNLIIDGQSQIYNNVEKNLYTIGKYRWKSEELMVKCIKNVFKNCEVIPQYKPYFLYVNKGQLSYDAYVPKLKIAFEYQGKQHFEPIDYFGGEESFKKQKNRDTLKMELSKKNKVNLIYINYWEDITSDLILQKLKEKNINL